MASIVTGLGPMTFVKADCTLIRKSRHFPRMPKECEFPCYATGPQVPFVHAYVYLTSNSGTRMSPVSLVPRNQCPARCELRTLRALRPFSDFERAKSERVREKRPRVSERDRPLHAEPVPSLLTHGRRRRCLIRTARHSAHISTHVGRVMMMTMEARWRMVLPLPVISPLRHFGRNNRQGKLL